MSIEFTNAALLDQFIDETQNIELELNEDKIFSINLSEYKEKTFKIPKNM